MASAFSGGASQFPNASNTGPRTAMVLVPEEATSGTGWSWHAGDQVVYMNSPDVTVEGINVHGSIIMLSGAAGSTLQDFAVRISKADGDINGVLCQADDAIIQYGRIANVAGRTALLAGGLKGIATEADNITISRNDVSGVEDPVFLGGLAPIVEDNYLHDVVIYDAGIDPHADGIQLFGGNACDGARSRRNNVDLDDDVSSAFTMGSNTDVIVDGNRFVSGAYNIRYYEDDGNAFVNNRLQQLDGGFGYTTPEGGGAGVTTFRNNVDDITDEFISEFQVLMLINQSNTAGRQTTALGGTLGAEEAQHPRVYKYPVTPGPLSLVTMPIAFSDGFTYDSNVTPGFNAAKAVANAKTNAKVVVIPGSYSGTGMDEWVSGQTRFDNAAAAWADFRDNNPDCELHAVIGSALEDEMANAVSTTDTATRFDAMLADIRALPGALGVPYVLGVPVPEWIDAGGAPYTALLLEGAKVATRHDDVGVIGGVPIGVSLGGGDNFLHYPNDEQRIRGTDMGDQIVTRIHVFNSQAPDAISEHELAGATLTFTSVGAPYYDIQTSPVGEGDWSSNLWVPNQRNIAGEEFVLTLPGSGSRDYRIIAKARAGDSIASSVGSLDLAASYLARMTNQPDPTVAGYYRDLVDALDAAGAFGSGGLDWAYVFCGHDRQASRLNIISSSYDCIEVGGTVTDGVAANLSWTQFRGFTGDGSTSYQRNGFIPSTAGGKMTQNSTGLGFGSRTSAGLGVIDIGCRQGSSSNQLLMQARNGSNVGSFRINVGTSPSTIAVADGSGRFISRRTASNAVATFRNGVSIQTYTNASVTLPNREMFIGGLNDNGTPNTLSTRELTFAFGGAAPDDTMVAAYDAAFAAFATAVGA